MIYLASRSPRRRVLLEQIGVAFRPVEAEIDETPRSGETPEALASRLARQKAAAARARLAPRDPEALVLGADTVVAVDGEVLGKPCDRTEAEAMLARLSGRRHRVLSAVALAGPGGVSSALSRSDVTFRRLRAAERAAYCATGEPYDKAGGYAIQGLAAVFVRRLAGSYSGVMGLPLFETARLLEAAGIDVVRPAPATPAQSRSRSA